MTDREKAIVEAFTGVCMLTGEKRSVFNKYVNEVMGKPIYTHEFAYNHIQEELKEKSKDDFVKLCKETTLNDHSGMTLGEFAGAVIDPIDVDMELRDADNYLICTCRNNSSAIEVYSKCKVIDWWSVKDNGRVIVHIDDSEVMRCIAGNVEGKQ